MLRGDFFDTLEGGKIVAGASAEADRRGAKKKKDRGSCARYVSEKGAVVTYIPQGGHEIPREAVGKTAEFFKGEQQK